MTGPVATRLDLILNLAQIEPLHIGPDHTDRMVFPDQALDIHRPQLDLIAFGLTQAWGCKRRRIGWRLRLTRKVAKQFVVSHNCLLRIDHRRESHWMRDPLHSANEAKDSHPLRSTAKLRQATCLRVS